jgi:hypothetical protein
MTTNQLIAMLFPLFTAAVVGLVALVVRKPWAEKSAKTTAQVEIEDIDDALARAESLIQTARQSLRRLKSPGANLTS